MSVTMKSLNIKNCKILLRGRDNRVFSYNFDRIVSKDFDSLGC
jgi:hypothetical protein